MSLFDSIKSAFKSSGGGTGGRIDVAGRFSRQRTAVTGTMANFFVAKDREHNDRMVGVKVLDIEKMELFEARFKGLGKPSEGQIAMMMKHPKVVETYEIGFSLKGEPVLVMEYIGGPSLQNIVVQHQEHHVKGRRMLMIRDMAEALKYVHDQGFIHRDICPRNFICLPETTGVKLIDFGLTVPATAPFMVAGNRTGTPLYMSPEIVRRRPTDKRVDIFSFGVTCYCLCCFEHPWQSQMLNGRAALQHDSSPPKDLIKRCPNIDPRLARTIMHALNPDVDARTADMDQFLHGIRQVEKAFVD
ncbi:serine/threonine protein kinase [Rubripirellula reticaptiva]|uniref:Serine/threonine-protein kinase PknB n=1 Tax=Rubripirellula reticaptiva TaxID=2528013 RepID=A0A5C6EKQ9_9BACT|nr:serine/threonine-protein kinase [Rubripirellula reticaptiva]TWU49408.1 Serine/threonine-protein kinase PknB [Rubripirellula reticaptiva]